MQESVRCAVRLPDIDPAWIGQPSADAAIRRWRLAIAEDAWTAVEEGVDLTVWMAAYQAVRDDLLAAVWTWAVPADLRAAAHYIRFGSGGRREDLLGSDLDNALLVDDEAVAEAVRPYLYNVIRVMHTFGCPPCDGFVMATNERWCGTLAQWEARIRHYFARPDWDHARFLYMMTDGRPLDDVSQWARLVSQVGEGIRASAFIRWEMAHLGIHRTVALGRFGQVRVRRAGGRACINIKEGLVTPLVHAIRLVSIAHGCPETETLARLRCLVENGVWKAKRAQALASALAFGWRLRLRAQAEAMLAGRPMTDEIDIDMLPSGWRDALLSHLQTAKELERWVCRQFPKPRGERL